MMKNLLFLFATGLFVTSQFACGSDSKPPVSVGKPLEQMDPSKAQEAIAKWDSTRSRVIIVLDSMGHAADSMYVVKGFHVPFKDIRSLMDNVGNDEQVFAMLAVETDKFGKPQFSLIFQAPDTTKERTIRYYEFTKPCPTNCPD